MIGMKTSNQLMGLRKKLRNGAGGNRGSTSVNAEAVDSGVCVASPISPARTAKASNDFDY